MAYSESRVGLALRATALFLTLLLAAWMITHTHWYVSSSLIVAAAAAQVALLMQFATRSNREIARFLDAVSLDDTSQSFSAVAMDRGDHELSLAMTRVLERLRVSRAQREEQARYLQALLNHIPVALVTIDEAGTVQLLNAASRHLFENSVIGAIAEFSRYGTGFVADMEALMPGKTAIVRIERATGTLQLKASATGFTVHGERRRIVSLQNIENELSARELVAWQTVIRTMAHEMMNSLAPISSLADTAYHLIRDVLKDLPPSSPHAAMLTDASDALETTARRSDGLLHFVQSHRRLTKPLSARPEFISVRRVAARLHRLFRAEFAARGICFTTAIEPETLEVFADGELLDQALINLVRNAMEALGGSLEASIGLNAYRDLDGYIVIAISDNGPGIAPEVREKVFVPFFTTKRFGSGVGLTLVRQIAAAHAASADISETEGGGATLKLKF